MKVKISSIRSFLAMIAYEIFLFKGCFEQIPFIYNMSDFLDLLVIIILFALILTDKNTKDDYMIFAIGAILGLIVLVTAKDVAILKIFLFIYSFKKIDFKEFIKKDFSIRLTFYFSVIILNQLGIIDGMTGGRYIDGVKTIERKSLGFAHPNYLGAITFSLACEYLYLIDFKVNVSKLLPLLVAFYIIYFIANSRTSAYVFLILMFLVILLNKTTIFRYKEAKAILKRFPIVCMLISVLGLISYITAPELLLKIDTNIWSRFFHVNNYIENYGINIFGSKMDELFVSINPLDNIYFYVLIKFGICTLLVYMILYNYMFKSLIQKNECGLIIILFGYCTMGLFESGVISITLNPFLFILAYLINERKIKNKENIDLNYKRII